MLPFTPTLSAGPSFTIESTNTPLKFVSKPSTLSAKSEVKVGIQGRITDQYGEKNGGDIITAIDGRIINQNEDLISYIAENKKVGDKITLTIYRNGQFLDLEMTLQERPSPLLYLTEVLSPVP